MSNNDPAAAQRAARMRREAEHRLLVQASMQAKRAGKLPTGRDSTGSEIVTAFVVLVVVIGMLVLVMRQAGSP